MHIFVDSGLSAVRNSEDVYLCPTDLGKPCPSREPQCWSLQDARGLIQGFGIQKANKIKQTKSSHLRINLCKMTNFDVVVYWSLWPWLPYVAIVLLDTAGSNQRVWQCHWTFTNYVMRTWLNPLPSNPWPYHLLLNASGTSTMKCVVTCSYSCSCLINHFLDSYALIFMNFTKFQNFHKTTGTSHAIAFFDPEDVEMPMYKRWQIQQSGWQMVARSQQNTTGECGVQEAFFCRPLKTKSKSSNWLRNALRGVRTLPWGFAAILPFCNQPGNGTSCAYIRV